MTTERRTWREVSTDLLNRIQRGEWAVGDQFPPLQELIEHYAASRQVMRRVFAHLTRLGVISCTQRHGCWVTAPLPRRRLVLARSSASELAPDQSGLVADAVEATGEALSVSPETFRDVPATAQIAALLTIAPGTPICARVHLHRVGDQAERITTDYFPQRIVDQLPGLAAAEPTRKALAATFDHGGWIVDHWWDEIDPGRFAVDGEAAALGIVDGDPVTEIRRVLWAHLPGELPRPVHVASTLLDPRRYTLVYDWEAADGSTQDNKDGKQ